MLDSLSSKSNMYDQHVKDKITLKKEFAKERATVAKLLSHTMTSAQNRKACQDMLKPYMDDTAKSTELG